MTTVLSIAAQVRFGTDDRIEEMIRAAVAGDRSALESVLISVERGVYTFAWRLIGDPAAAEDITQEVLLKIARNLGRYRPGTSLWSWIHRIVINQVHDYRRHSAVRQGTLALKPSYEPELNERINRLQEALGLLTAKEHEVIILLDVEGYTSREAAAVLGTLAITVRTRAAYARKKLRRFLSRYYPELGDKQ